MSSLPFLVVLAFMAALISMVLVGSPAARADEPPQPQPEQTQPAPHDALALAQARLYEARAQATEIAGKIAAAQSDQARLEAEIADAERRIPELRARAGELREQVKQRAADLYVRHGNDAAFQAAMDAENAQDGLRASHLTQTIGDHDLDVAVEARDTAARLAASEDDLRAQHADLERTLASLAPLNDLLQKRLTVAGAALDRVRLLVVDHKSGVDVATLASVCPVDGVTVFTDDFGEPRSGGTHPGIDMAAVADTPVVALVGGVVRHETGGDGGNAAWLLGADDVTYYYAHFSRYEGGDRLVAAGDVIGYVGQTGNATGPHLHFELHPRDAPRPGAPTAAVSPPVDPYATLLGLCDFSS